MAGLTVAVSLVTLNSEQYIEQCLDTVFSQTGVHLEVVVVDNASTDDTRKLLAKYRPRLRLIRNDRNVGFAAAQNQGIACSTAPWVLVLNPDVLLGENFLKTLLKGAEADTRVGTICGKLLSIGRGFTALPEPKIDSAGIYFTPAMRHFDRGWGEPDDGRYERLEYVFGACAAAALYRRAMIDDISIHGEFFDPDFFVYREDADVAWRAQLLGWSCLYMPIALAHHVRTVKPPTRKSVAPLFNMHSVKNRFLMRIKNLTPIVWRRCWARMMFRDLMVIGGCVFREPRSLEAFWRLAWCWRRAWRKRHWIMARRRASDVELAWWFRPEPAVVPLETDPEGTTSLAAARLRR